MIAAGILLGCVAIACAIMALNCFTVDYNGRVQEKTDILTTEIEQPDSRGQVQRDAEIETAPAPERDRFVIIAVPHPWPTNLSGEVDTTLWPLGLMAKDAKIVNVKLHVGAGAVWCVDVGMESGKHNRCVVNVNQPMPGEAESR